MIVIPEYFSRIKVATQINYYTRAEWSALALVAIFMRALSSSSLLVMLRVRQNYVVVLIMEDEEEMDCVTCPHDRSVIYSFYQKEQCNKHTLAIDTL